MKTITMNYPIAIQVEEESQVTKAYCFHVPGATVEYGSNGSSVSKMKKTVKSLVDDAIKFSHREYQQKRIIATSDGHVLLVCCIHGAWGYFQASGERNYAGSCSGSNDFDKTLDDARKHAESSYGGILWECSC